MERHERRSERLTEPPETRITRRRLLLAAGGLIAGGGLAAVLLERGGSGDAALLRLPKAEPEPTGQHRWNAVLRRDESGNRLLPRHNRLLLFDVAAADPKAARRLERALRLTERAFAYGPGGILITVAWGPSWFERLGLESPIPQPKALSSTEAPDLDRFDACIHLAGDDEDTVAAVDRALTAGERSKAIGASVDVRPALALRERRIGFSGAPLPRDAAARIRPPVALPPQGSPLMMGFKSGTRRNQAREGDVTISSGPWRGGTTMHLSEISLTLDSWYHSLDERGRVARMFGPQTSVSEARHPGAGVRNPKVDLAATARRYGVIGHAQSMRSARREDRPRILRRDFNGVQSDQPTTHFVSLQRSIADFEKTRSAMNAARAADADPRVGSTLNNGIKEWMRVRRRANFLVPPRPRRSFPGLPGWDA